MVKCSVYMCQSATYKNMAGISFHRFPKDKRLCEAWLKNANLESWTPYLNSVICSLHFEQNLLKRNSFRITLVQGAIPTIFEQDSESNECNENMPKISSDVQYEHQQPSTNLPVVQQHVTIPQMTTKDLQCKENMPTTSSNVDISRKRTATGENISVLQDVQYQNQQPSTSCQNLPVVQQHALVPQIITDLQTRVTAKKSKASQQANERQQPSESSRTSRPPEHHAERGKNEKLYPISESSRNKCAAGYSASVLQDVQNTSEIEQQPSSSSHCALTVQIDITKKMQDHNYHQPILSSLQARLQPPSATPTEQGDQLPESKEIIFNVYNFLQDEYKRLKQFTGDTCDLSPLAHILGRTAEATGVSEKTVCRILRERKRPSHVKGDGGETKRMRLSQDESVSSPNEQDTRSSVSTDSDPNADDIAETNEDENETGTLKLKFEVDEEYSEAGSKTLVMTIDPLTVQPTSTAHRIPSPEYIQMETECEIKMDPDEMVDIQSSSVHVELSPTHPEVKLEPSETQSQHEDPSLTLDIAPVFSEGDHFSRGAVHTISNHRRKKSD